MLSNLSQATIDMHTDQGMFLVMTAAEYLDTTPKQEAGGKSPTHPDSGLLIQLPTGRYGDSGGRVVRPDFDEGSLLFMLGDGLRMWMRADRGPGKPEVPTGTLHEVQVIR